MSPPGSAVLEPLFVQPVAATSAAINPRAIKVRLIFTSLKRKDLIKLRNGRLKAEQISREKDLTAVRPFDSKTVRAQASHLIEHSPFAVAHVLLNNVQHNSGEWHAEA